MSTDKICIFLTNIKHAEILLKSAYSNEPYGAMKLSSAGTGVGRTLFLL